MAAVSIGVPVYNGASLIGECLDCLTQQTFADLEIIVSDNASTDDTGRIVQEYAARDPRIRYIRQPQNIGLMNNFRAVFEASTSPLFIFRCHDDLSSPNYVEALHEALMAQPSAALAVSRVETLREKRKNRFHPMPRLDHAFGLLNVRDLLFKSHAAWFCGLWKVADLRPVFERVWALHDTPWGPDHLTIYSFLVTQRVALAPRAIFIQRITKKQGDAAYSRPRVRELVALRKSFMDICRDFRRERGITGGLERALAVLTWFYTGKRIYRARNLLGHALLGRW
jgi:glycosyltransferase involved in cell wall biosynthesis